MYPLERFKEAFKQSVKSIVTARSYLSLARTDRCSRVEKMPTDFRDPA